VYCWPVSTNAAGRGAGIGGVTFAPPPSVRRSRPTLVSAAEDAPGYTAGVADVLVGVTGGIAAYKAPGVIRRLKEAGHEVRTIATEAAFRFVPEETIAIVAGCRVHTDETWWEESGRVEHVSLARWADLVLVAPATADAMARAAIGLGDDLLSATILAGAKKVLWAPAMNPEMWNNPSTQRNVETLKGWGHSFVGPAEGLMASAEEEPGVGRLAEEAEIVAAAEEVLSEGGS
jgi:phosphopantothenoylcysteine synthetase/decarboxylase